VPLEADEYAKEYPPLTDAVVIDGVGIRPGDLIFADSSGAVAIPGGQVDEVIAEAQRIVAADAGFMEQIRTEDPADFRGDEH
jgi:regulator of RNase E activity RraA